MSTNNLPVHRTTTHRIKNGKNGEWEFSCPVCGYRARYIYDPAGRSRKLEILSIGDPNVRHSSSREQPVEHGGWRLNSRNEYQDREEYSDEGWLTPEIRQTLEKILKGLDFDSSQAYG